MAFVTVLLLSFVSANSLTLVDSNEKNTLSLKDLLRDKNTQTVVLPKDPMNAGKRVQYQALPASELFSKKSMKDADSFHFIAKDGMTVIVSKQRILAEQPKAWLALKPVNGVWAKARKGQPIGPYYLFWTDPEGVGPEEWIFQVNRVELKESPEKLYPSLMPGPKMKGFHPVSKGQKVFFKNCFPCHSLNKLGGKKMGPDLIWPHSPLQYWQKKYLKIFIRNSRTLRYWPESKMPSFTKEEISDKELENLFKYLQFLKTQRE